MTKTAEGSHCPFRREPGPRFHRHPNLLPVTDFGKTPKVCFPVMAYSKANRFTTSAARRNVEHKRALTLLRQVQKESKLHTMRHTSQISETPTSSHAEEKRAGLFRRRLCRCDFGLAKIVNDSVPRRSASGPPHVEYWKPEYMAPEQMHGAKPGARATLCYRYHAYHMLGGRLRSLSIAAAYHAKMMNAPAFERPSHGHTPEVERA